MMNEWSKGAFGQLQCRESDGQVKTPWPGASRIKIEHTVNSLDKGPMRVAGNDHVNSAGYEIQLELIDIVEDVDRAPAEPRAHVVDVVLELFMAYVRPALP
jgi:hypothetical protein